MQTAKRFILTSTIHPDERHTFSLLFLHSFLLGFATSFYFVAANAYFLKKVAITNIPIAYIIAGTIGVFLMGFYRAIQRKAGVIASFISSLVGFAVVCLLLYFFHSKTDDHPIALYVSYAGFILVFPFSVLFVVGFASVNLQLFNLSQSKRLSALIGTGEVIASIIGYLLVPLFLKITGTPSYLFLISACAIFLSIIPIRKLAITHHLKKDKQQLQQSTIKINWKYLRKEKFFTGIALATVFSVMAFYLSDYSYLISIRALSKISGIEASIIISVLFSVIKAGELLFSMLSGNIISRKGMQFSLLVLPLILVVSSLFALLSNFIFEDVAFFLIAFFMLNKWCERVIRKGITMPAMKVLYQLAPPAERPQIQSSIEGSISQFSIIISGLLLLIITRSQTTTNPLSFLYVMSIVSVIVFTIWLVLVTDLYAKYRRKIEAYLHHLQPAKNTHHYPTLQQWINEKKTVKNETELERLTATLTQVTQLLLENEQKVSERFIACYNPALQTALDNGDEHLNKKIVNAYFNNDNIFNRLLIIRHMQYLSNEEKQKFVYEMYELSDTMLRLELLTTLNSNQFTANNHFYFANLCQGTVQEILWADAALEDLIPLNNKALNREIETYQLHAKNLLLELLKLLYDKQAIQVIQEVLNAADINLEKQIFAVELLDNIVTDELKETIIPIFEPITFQVKKQRLEKFFPLYQLTVTERLKDIVMKDYKLINCYTKELALYSYYQLTGDKLTLKAFRNSSIESLSAMATTLLDNEKNSSFNKKEHVSEALKLTSYIQKNKMHYFMQYALFVKDAKKRSNLVPLQDKNENYVLPLSTIDNSRFEVDALGLGILLQL